MISRTWHGLVPLNKKDAFYKYLNETGVKEAVSIPGNLGAYVHVEDQGQYAHFFLCTVWSSWEDIVKFAGNRPTIAVTYPEDRYYELVSDPIVIHQEVTTDKDPFTCSNNINSQT